jgi:hypothetical protein
MYDYRKIDTLDNVFEAQLLESILREHGIPHRLQSYQDTPFDGLYQTQKGWGHVSAPEEYATEIKEILGQMRKDAADVVISE